MAIRKIRIMGDGVLTKKCKEVKEVTPRIRQLIDDMIETMYEEMGELALHLSWTTQWSWP